MITPDVAQKPLFKGPNKALDDKEETKGNDSLKHKVETSSLGGIKKANKISDKTILFNDKVDEPTLIGSD